MKIAIICLGQFGDVAEATGVLEYQREIWGKNPEVHWFVSRRFRQVLDHNPGVIIHEMGDDARPAFEEAQKIANSLGLIIVVPAAYMNAGLIPLLPLPRIPPHVCGLELKGRHYRPQIHLTQEEIDEVTNFMSRVPQGCRIMLETACFSRQGEWKEEYTRQLVDRLHPVLLTASFGEVEKIKGFANVVGLDGLNYRQLTEVYNHCHMYVGVPSGAASVTCASRCRELPRFELLSSDRCPKAGKLAPDWGTSAMRPCMLTDRPQILLDRVVERAQNRGRRRKQRRRRVFRAGSPLGR